MRIFSFLALIVVLAIVLIQYKNNIVGSGTDNSGALSTDKIEDSVNKSLSDYQKKLEDSLPKKRFGITSIQKLMAACRGKSNVNFC